MVVGYFGVKENESCTQLLLNSNKNNIISRTIFFTLILTWSRSCIVFHFISKKYWL